MEVWCCGADDSDVVVKGQSPDADISVAKISEQEHVLATSAEMGDGRKNQQQEANTDPQMGQEAPEEVAAEPEEVSAELGEVRGKQHDNEEVEDYVGVSAQEKAAEEGPLEAAQSTDVTLDVDVSGRDDSTGHSKRATTLGRVLGSVHSTVSRVSNGLAQVTSDEDLDVDVVATETGRSRMRFEDLDQLFLFTRPSLVAAGLGALLMMLSDALPWLLPYPLRGTWYGLSRVPILILPAIAVSMSGKLRNRRSVFFGVWISSSVLSVVVFSLVWDSLIALGAALVPAMVAVCGNQERIAATVSVGLCLLGFAAALVANTYVLPLASKLPGPIAPLLPLFLKAVMTNALPVLYEKAFISRRWFMEPAALTVMIVSLMAAAEAVGTAGVLRTVVTAETPWKTALFVSMWMSLLQIPIRSGFVKGMLSSVKRSVQRCLHRWLGSWVPEPVDSQEIPELYAIKMSFATYGTWWNLAVIGCQWLVYVALEPYSNEQGVMHRLYVVETSSVAIGFLAILVAEAVALCTVVFLQRRTHNRHSRTEEGHDDMNVTMSESLRRATRVGGITPPGFKPATLSLKNRSRQLNTSCCGFASIGITEFAAFAFTGVFYAVSVDALNYALKFPDMKCPTSFKNLGGWIENTPDETVHRVWYPSDCVSHCTDNCAGFMHTGGECRLFKANTTLTAPPCQCAGVTSCRF